ncbi:MAG TPA: PspC domain-containing protein [Candidatus Limnocylindrales bacterium]|nr:PspC domain-containing protein [Candidatus Limnocylindrales bacterium]
MTDRLYRSRDDRMLAGVAGGVADTLDLDPSLIRIIWVVLSFLTGGIAIVVYIVMAIVVPEAPVGSVSGPAPPPGGPTDGADPAASPGAPDWAPPAGATLAPAPRHQRDPADRARGGLVLGILLIVIGGLFLVRQLVPALDFSLVWPIVAIALGVLLIVVAITPPRHSG